MGIPFYSKEDLSNPWINLTENLETLFNPNTIIKIDGKLLKVEYDDILVTDGEGNFYSEL